MKKILSLILIGAMTLSVAGCGNTASASSNSSDTTATVTTEAKPETVTITSLNGNKEAVELEVPYDAQRIAILDLAALDIIDNLGLGDRVVGTADTSIDYLSKYADDSSIQALGTIKEADLEAVMECEPDVIFIGGRLSSYYDALSEIAPVVYLSTDTEIGLVESVTKNASIIASMFGLEDEIAAKTADFASRITALQTVAQGKTALVGMTTSGSVNLLGNDGRCSIIGVEIGFNNLTATSSSSTHGNETSFETILKSNPDYIFILDRDSAIGTDGAQLAQQIMENELVEQTQAYQNGNIIYLEHPAVWYTAEGGITALDTMLSDLESALISK